MSSQKCSLQLSLLLVAAHVREFLLRFVAYFTTGKYENRKFDCQTDCEQVGRLISCFKKKMTGDTGRGYPSSHDEEEDETTTTVAALPRDVLVVRLFFLRSKSESSHFFLLFLQHKRRINRASLACDSLSLARLRKKKSLTSALIVKNARSTTKLSLLHARFDAFSTPTPFALFSVPFL